MKTTSVTCASVALAVFATSAEADVSKVWAAAKDNLPVTTKGVLVVDVAVAVKSSSFGQLFPLAVAQERDLEQGLALIKATCKIDPVAAIEGLVVAGDPILEQGVVYLQLSGIDRPKLSSCIEAVFKAMKEQGAVKQDGVFTSISVDNESAHLAWVAKDVIAFSIEPEKKALLQAWIGQQGAFAKAPVTTLLAKVDPKALAWGAVALDKPLDEDSLPLKSGFGTLTLANGVLATELRGLVESAKIATASVARFKKELARETDRKGTPASVKKVAKAFALSATGADVVLKARVSEKDFLAALLEALK